METEMLFAAIAEKEGITSEEADPYDNYMDRCRKALDLCVEKAKVK